MPKVVRNPEAHSGNRGGSSRFSHDFFSNNSRMRAFWPTCIRLFPDKGGVHDDPRNQGWPDCDCFVPGPFGRCDHEEDYGTCSIR